MSGEWDSFREAILQNNTSSLKRILTDDINKSIPIDQPVQDKFTAMHLALKHNNIDTARLLLEHGADPQVKHSFKGHSYLHVACEASSADMVKLLLQHMNINVLNDLNQTPLFVAVSHEKYEVAELLVKNKADVDAGDSCSPLLEATRNKNIPLIRLLLEHGADTNKKSSSGYTPFQQYFRSFPEDTGELLDLYLSHGADVNSRCGCSGESVLDLAATHSTLDAIDKLLQAYRYANAEKGSDQSALNMIFTSIAFYVSAHDYSEDTLLKKVRLFVRYGADVNAVNADGRTPLFYVIKASTNRYFKVIKYLISQGADIYGDGVKSPIVELLKTGDIDMVEYLLGLGSKLDFRDRNIVAHVAEYGSVAGLRFLIENGATLKLNGASGNKIFVKAISHCKTEMVEYLLELGANVNYESDGQVALSHALKVYSPEWSASEKLVRVLVKQVALLAEVESKMHKTNEELIRSEEWVARAYENYKLELEDMKGKKLCLEPDVTYFDILTKSAEELSDCVPSKISKRNLTAKNFGKLYPLFCDELQAKYVKWLESVLQTSVLENTRINDSVVVEECEVERSYVEELEIKKEESVADEMTLEADNCENVSSNYTKISPSETFSRIFLWLIVPLVISVSYMLFIAMNKMN